MEHRFTKCECCPYYACIEENSGTRKWDCSKLKVKEKCVYNYSLDYDSRLKLIKLWIDANIKGDNELK